MRVLRAGVGWSLAAASLWMIPLAHCARVFRRVPRTVHAISLCTQASLQMLPPYRSAPLGSPQVQVTVQAMSLYFPASLHLLAVARCSSSEAGSYLRRIDSCITQLKAQGPSRTCNERSATEPSPLCSTFSSSFFFFFFTLVTGPRRSLSLKLSDTRVYEHQIRAALATDSWAAPVLWRRLSKLGYLAQDVRVRGSWAKYPHVRPIVTWPHHACSLGCW